MGFLLVAGCLLLPFLGIVFESPVQNGRFGWTGVDLAVGGDATGSLNYVWYADDGTLKTESTTLEESYGDDRAQQFLPHKFLHSQAIAIAAVMLVLAGLFSAILAGQRVQSLVAAVSGFGAAAALAIAEIRALDFTGPFTSPEYGFWLALSLLLLLGAANAFHAFRHRYNRGT